MNMEKIVFSLCIPVNLGIEKICKFCYSLNMMIAINIGRLK